jgi:antitoxin component YwqK of YwqJK toxin-antitoxin module
MNQTVNNLREGYWEIYHSNGNLVRQVIYI